MIYAFLITFLYYSSQGYSLLGNGVCGGRDTYIGISYNGRITFDKCKEECDKRVNCTGISWASDETTEPNCGMHLTSAPSAPHTSGTWTEPYQCYLKSINNTKNNDTK